MIRLMVVVLAIGTLASQAPEVRFVGAIPIGDERPVGLMVSADGSLAVVTSLSSYGPVRLRLLRPDGSEALRRDMAGTLPAARVAGDRLHLSMRSPDDWSVVHHSVVNVADGTVIGTATSPLTHDAQLSGRADALVHVSSFDHAWSRDVHVKSVKGDRSRTLTVPDNVAFAAAVDYDRVFVALGKGQLEAFDGNTRRWSVPAPGMSEGLDVSRDGSLVLLSLQMGLFRVYDGATGKELYTYEPVDPGQAMTQLGIDALLAKGGPVVTTGPQWPEMRTQFTPLNSVLLVGEQGVFERFFELNPRSGLLRHLGPISQFWQALEAAGFQDPRAGSVRGAQRVAVDPGATTAAAFVRGSVLIARLR